MILRARWMGIVVAMLLTFPCLGAHAATDSTAVRGGSSPGRGGVGGVLGGTLFVSSEDFSTGALPRFSFDGHWRYQMNTRVRIQVGVAFTWAAYSKDELTPFTDPAFSSETDKEGYLAHLLPVIAHAQWTFGKRPWGYYNGAGPGLYRVMVQHERKVLRDPDPTSLLLHRVLY